MDSLHSSRQSTRRYDDVMSTESPFNTTEGVYNYYKEEQMTFLYILLVLILVGNSLVVLAITLTKSRKSRMHIFILNLAIAGESLPCLSVLSLEV
ncbi:hypothetical protein RRG08_027193 [Elysia crispata]|uniref:G-protein coupled receptors family 1 profile domain-containing protein n=1 Tax=Elysia crispata TaxID=231223 RepID=A0AAE1A640_9GAST|nr:hypothetical protein RRG08_027193 [Elysia crispata]